MSTSYTIVYKLEIQDCICALLQRHGENEPNYWVGLPNSNKQSNSFRNAKIGDVIQHFVNVVHISIKQGGGWEALKETLISEYRKRDPIQEKPQCFNPIDRFSNLELKE